MTKEISNDRPLVILHSEFAGCKRENESLKG